VTIETARTIGRSPANPKHRDWEEGEDRNHYWRDNRAVNHSRDSDTQREWTGLTGGHLLDPSQRHDSCMKHVSCGLQNQEGSHSQRGSLAACLGGNITPPSSWASQPSTLTGALGVVAAGGMEGVCPVVREVTPMLEVGDLLVEAPSFQAVADGGEFLILALDLCDDGAPVCFELSASLVVSLILLDFCGGRDVDVADHCSHSKEGGPCGLEEFLAPVGHGVDVPS